MNSFNFFLRRFDLSLMNDKFISALNKSSERYNKTKKNYPQSLDWFKNYVISNFIMSLGRTKELEINDVTYYDIHQYLKKHYSDKIEERWNELRSDSLQEQIKKVLKEMVNESKDWGDSKQKLERTFKFKDFNESIEFVNKVAKIAEKQNHHPDITINYNKVKISITDHEKGKVSEKCHKLVNDIDKL
jgi:4a-hydroxytetrahydrobiopterin dehydratase